MHEHQLLSLYDSVLVPILSEWISDDDLCCLDSAVCSVDRPNFLRTLERCSINSTAPLSENVFEQYKSWLLLRGLGLKRYSTGNRTTKQEQKLLFKNKHLNRLESSDMKFASILQMGVVADRLHVNHIIWPSAERLEAIGHLITDIATILPIDKRVAEACPNLRSIDTRSLDVTLSVVDHCQKLETVYLANLKGLLERRQTDKLLCDLKRTYEADESAICLGEDKKYFNLTGLYIQSTFNEENVTLLLPLVQHLVKLSIGCHSRIMLEITAKCYGLRALAIAYVPQNVDDFLLLLSHSPNLTSFRVTEKLLPCVDPFIVALSHHCPLLNNFTSYSSIENADLLPHLFKSCALKKFEYFLNSAGVAINSRGVFCSQRYPVTCTITEEKHSKILDSILQSLPHLTSMNIEAEESCIINLKRQASLTSLKITRYESYLVLIRPIIREREPFELEICQCCPNLTRLDLSNNKYVKNKDILALLQMCPKIEHLRLVKCSSITVELLTAIKSTSLLSIEVFGTITKKSFRPIEKKVSFQIICNKTS